MEPATRGWIGRNLANTYYIERQLGQGGMGAVFLARHLRTGGMVAIKVLIAGTVMDTFLLRRFQDEARIVSGLRHPHIVQVMDLDQDEAGNPYIVMEFLEGEDLHAKLTREVRLPWPVAIEYAQQIGSALSSAHGRGIIHRDIKPQNIFLVRRTLAGSGSDLAKILDFGISKIRRSTQMTPEMTIMGTPSFMAPEAAMGLNSTLDGRADQFSMAVLLYLALSGHLPFQADEPLAILFQIVHQRERPLVEFGLDLPAHLPVAIHRALAKRPEDRFPDMDAFVCALLGVKRAPMGTSPRESPLASQLLGPGTLAASAGQTVSPGRRSGKRVHLVSIVVGSCLLSGAAWQFRTSGWPRLKSGENLPEPSAPASNKPGLSQDLTARLIDLSTNGSETVTDIPADASVRHQEDMRTPGISEQHEDTNKSRLDSAKAHTIITSKKASAPSPTTPKQPKAVRSFFDTMINHLPTDHRRESEPLK